MEIKMLLPQVLYTTVDPTGRAHPRRSFGGEIPFLWHMLHFSVRMSPHLQVQYRQPYAPLSNNTWIYGVKYRSRSICPWGAPIWFHCLRAHYSPQWHRAEPVMSAEGRRKGLHKGQLIHHAAFLLGDPRAKEKDPRGSLICCWPKVRVDSWVGFCFGCFRLCERDLLRGKRRAWSQYWVV